MTLRVTVVGDESRRVQVLLAEQANVGSTLQKQGVRSAMAAPLRLRDRTLGLVYVDDRGLPTTAVIGETLRRVLDERGIDARL